MSNFIRAFLAFDIDKEYIITQLEHIQRLLIQTGSDVKLVAPSNIHITVRFLGDISNNMVDKISHEMEKTKFKPFDIHIKNLGVFPNLNYPRVIWAGITVGIEEIEKIFSQLEPKLNRLGLPLDSKGFSPHLTIARIRSGKNKDELQEFVKKHENYDFGQLNLSCLKLKKSDLTSKGPIYSTLYEYCPP